MEYLMTGLFQITLILLGLALSSNRFCIFGLHVLYVHKIFLVTSCSLLLVS